MEGGRGRGQLRAAEGEPGRTARQGDWAAAQTGWRGDGGQETRRGRGGGRETQEDGDLEGGHRDSETIQGTVMGGQRNGGAL